MGKVKKEINRLLKKHGTLVPSKKHKKYRLDNGATFILACSPSDHRSLRNALSDLKKALAWKPPSKDN